MVKTKVLLRVIPFSEFCVGQLGFCPVSVEVEVDSDLQVVRVFEVSKVVSVAGKGLGFGFYEV